MEKTFRDLNGGKAMSAADRKQASLVERAKFQFEADSEDEEMENEIDSNLDALGGAAARLNGLARATGKEVDEQNRHLERINQKSSKVDDEVCSHLFSLPPSQTLERHCLLLAAEARLIYPINKQIAMNRARLDRFK